MDGTSVEFDAQLQAKIVAQLAQQEATAWLPNPGALTIEPLSAGAYHKNFLVRSEGVVTVARYNRKSQWGLSSSEQLRREFFVLSDVQESNVTPVPLALWTGDPPFLIESFIDGFPFRYGDDLDHAARAIGAVHSQPIRKSLAWKQTETATSFLLTDGMRWLKRADLSGGPTRTSRILRTTWAGLRRGPKPTESPSVIVHTDLIHSNLLSTLSGCSIVDWEGARQGPAAWDLAYFLSPVTLRWAPFECSPVTPADANRFLQIYSASAKSDLDTIRMAVQAFLPYVIFRALAWCLAYQECEDLDQETADSISRFTDPEYVESVLRLHSEQ
jgi:aminoglycoside phosphotransferase (APT) family kinase protein